MTACRNPLSEKVLVDYVAGDLAADQLDAVEEHLLGCDACTAAAEGLAAVVEALRAQTPPVIRAADVDKLRARGMKIVENTFAPGDRREAAFARDVHVLIHRLSGLDLANAARVDFELIGERTHFEIARVDDVPFDPDAGAVLVACRQHYSGTEPDTVAKLRVVAADGTERHYEFTILHRFE